LRILLVRALDSEVDEVVVALEAEAVEVGPTAISVNLAEVVAAVVSEVALVDPQLNPMVEVVSVLLLPQLLTAVLQHMVVVDTLAAVAEATVCS
jgi:hypothetical protein